MAKVLVGIPTWRRPQMVKTAIDSVIGQTFTDIRIIVSDNASPASMASEVADYINSLNDPRIEFFAQPVNCAEKGQMAYFLDRCEEDYLVFLHDDDRMEPELLAEAVAVLEREESVDFFSSDQYVFGDNGELLPQETEAYYHSLKRDQLKDGIVQHCLEKVLERGIFSVSGSVFRAETLRRCGLQDSLTSLPCDMNVFLRQAENNAVAWWDSRRLAGYRFHEDQMSRQWCWEYNEQYIQGYIEMLEPRRFTGKAERLRKFLLSFGYRRYAYILMGSSRFSEGHQFLRKSLVTAPFSPRNWAYFAFGSILPFLVPTFWKSRITLAGTTDR
jgi:glycosyltransferase involved in cell wall biosynthesis